MAFGTHKEGPSYQDLSPKREDRADMLEWLKGIISSPHIEARTVADVKAEIRDPKHASDKGRPISPEQKIELLAALEGLKDTDTAEAAYTYITGRRKGLETADNMEKENRE